MRYVLWVMLVAFAMGGALLILHGIRGLWTMAKRRRSLIRSMGTIQDIEKKHVQVTLKRASNRPHFSFVPIIRFMKDSGEVVEFRSEVGDYGTETKYRVGQTVLVVYDPGGILQPMINSWLVRWGSHFLIIVVGILFWGGAALIYWLIGRFVLEGK